MSKDYDNIIKQKIINGENALQTIREMALEQEESLLLKNVSTNPKNDVNYRKLEDSYKKYNYSYNFIKANFDACLEYCSCSNVLNKDLFANFCTDLFHRILYSNVSKNRDWGFLYDEFYCIVKEGFSIYYEKILKCLKNLKSLDNTLDITPFIRELYDASEFFNNHYLRDSIKLFCYQFALELDEFLSEEEKITIESLVLKNISDDKNSDKILSYNSAYVNYLYAKNIKGADIQSHKKIIIKEKALKVLSLFEEEIEKKPMLDAIHGFSRVKKD